MAAGAVGGMARGEGVEVVAVGQEEMVPALATELLPALLLAATRRATVDLAVVEGGVVVLAMGNIVRRVMAWTPRADCRRPQVG